MLSRLAVTFLPRSKCLLILWLQSPSAVILEPKKIKSATVSTVSPSICHEVMMGPDAMILVFWMLSFKPTFSLYEKSAMFIYLPFFWMYIFICVLRHGMKVKVTRLCPTVIDPMNCTIHGILQARKLELVVFSFFRGSPQPRDGSQVSHIAGGFFTNWQLPGKPKNAGVCSLFLLQWIFLIQESNQSLLHCRQILY